MLNSHPKILTINFFFILLKQLFSDHFSEIQTFVQCLNFTSTNCTLLEQQVTELIYNLQYMEGNRHMREYWIVCGITPAKMIPDLADGMIMQLMYLIFNNTKNISACTILLFK